MNQRLDADVAIVGAGMAGASLAYELSRLGLRCLLLESESQPGYHTTGRSAALYAPLYGNRPVRALTRASRGFYDAPPPGFAEHPLLVPRPTLFYASLEQREALQAFQDEMAGEGPLQPLAGAAAVRAQVPVLRESAAALGLLDTSSSDIDVAALLQGYLKGAKALGATLLCGFDAAASVERLGQGQGQGWRLTDAGRELRVGTVAICAGAWADPVAAAFGAAPPGIEPRRRTAVVFEPVDGPVPARMPMAISVIEDLYFRPEAGRVLLSPADETPSPACDVQPEELDIAIALDRLERDTLMTPKRITARWAGLRSFAADRSPVAGFDPQVPGLFWMVGQGGYGIQMAPALAAFSAAAIAGLPVPQAIVDEGFDPATVAPGRFIRG